MGFLTEKELRKIGLKHIGNNVKISDKASFHNAKNISIGDNSRIDDFCVLSAGDGGIDIGRNVHISVFCSLIGNGKIFIEDFAACSSRVSLYTSNDDYSGDYMTNPTVDSRFTNVTHGDIYVGKHVIIGAGSIILPGVILEEGCCVGALSLVKDRCKAFYMYAGVPAKVIKKRSNKILKLEKEFMEKYK